MSKVFLTLNLVVESDSPLADIYEGLKADLDFLLEEHWRGAVVNINLDRIAQSEFVRALHHEPEKLGEVYLSPSADVAAVLGLYNLTLPKQRKSDPEWRLPKGHCIGEVDGLAGLRGRLILTNGIMGFLVREDGRPPSKAHWTYIHYKHFIPDDISTLPDGLPVPTGKKTRKDSKVEACFAEFAL